MNIKKYIYQNFQKSFIYWLPKSLSGKAWEESYSYLNEYNKTVITLSSSALILSITAIQLRKANFDKILLIISWSLFILVLILGVLLHFSNYLHTVTAKIIELKAKNKKYKDNIEFINTNEANLYFSSRTWMFFLSFFQLIVFIAALIILMITTIKLF